MIDRLAAVALIAVLSGGGGRMHEFQREPVRKVVTGAYVADPNWPDWAAALDQYDRYAGARPKVNEFYTGWDSPFPLAFVRTIDSRRQTPFITWQGWSDSAGVNDARYSDSKIVAGDFDGYIRSWASGAKAWGGPLYVRWGCEANGSWNEWDPGVNGNTAASYIAAFRRVRSIFKEVGASNVTFLWTPMAAFTGSTPLQSIYPGDEYVDLVGIDGYNWGTTRSWSTWQSFDQLFDATLATVRQITSKPIWLTEVASAEQGGDKAAWMKGMFAHIAKDPRISGFIWFNTNKETDWRIESSAESQAAFKERMASELFS